MSSTDSGTHIDELGEAVPEEFEVRRRVGLAVLLAGGAWLLTAGYLLRVTSEGASWLDWTIFVVIALLALVYTRATVDGRTPLLVVDTRGVRFRQGPVWSGLAWSEVQLVEHLPRRGLLRDGWVLVAPRESVVGSSDDPRSDLTVPLSLSTRVAGVPARRVSELLDQLSGDDVEVVEIDPGLAAETEDDVEAPEGLDTPSARELTDGYSTNDDEQAEPIVPWWKRGSRAVRERLPEPRPFDQSEADDTTPLPALEALRPSPTPSPLRDPREAVRAQLDRETQDNTVGANALRLDPGDNDLDDTVTYVLPEVAELRRSDDALRDARSSLAGSSGTEAVVIADGVSPIATPGQPVEPLVVDDFPPAPAPDPVIGPDLSAARTRLGLTVDRIAERTRIRPHVIESIEVDDFAPCGGDFYARGHLRTLARVLGIDAGPLLAKYDDRYADAPIDPRRVFEAELATSTGGSIRGTRGGPNWSVLVAAVMAVVLLWSIARLVMEAPVAVTPPTPRLNGSAGPNNAAPGNVKPVPVELTAAGGGARVIVRDGSGDIVYDGNLAFGQSVAVDASPPVRVSSTDGSLEVTVDGKDHGALGGQGQDAQDTFVAD